MKMIAIAIMQVGITLYPPLSDAQAGWEEPSPALKQCIGTNAPAVEQAITSLTEGADFLILKVCAGPAADQAREIARQQAARQQKKLDEACKAAADKKDNYTDGIRQDPTLMGMCNSPMKDIFSDTDTSPYYSAMPFGVMGASSPSATSLAAQTLLQLRVERLKQKK
ncbi:MAG: hypothetical protein QM773_00085 [Hyphomonadaceae bacterium]